MTAVPVTLRTGRPLAPMQRALWMSQRRHPTAPLQNMAHVSHIQGQIDAQRLAAAFAEVVAASDALRTRIVEQEGVPSVQVGSEPAVSEIYDMSPEHVQTWADARVAQPIDIGNRGYDSVVLRHEDGTVSWYLALHHTVTDATSHALVFDSTARAYRGEQVESRSYYDWAQATVDADDLRVQRADARWRGRPEAPGVGRLYEPVRTTTPDASRLELEVSTELHDLVKERLRGDYTMLTEELAWSTLLTAAVSLYIHTVARVDQFSVGMPVHNRSDPVARDLIGALVEVFPVDIEVAPDDTFRTFHKRVARRVMETLRSAVPGTSPQGDYEAIVNVISRAGVDLFGDIPTHTRWVHAGAIEPSHLLRVQLTSFGDGFQLALDLNHAAAGPRHRLIAGEHFLATLRALVTEPDQPIGSRSLVTDGERAALERWGTGPDASPDFRSVVGRLEDALADRDDVALQDGDRSWTGRELWLWATDIGGWLRNSGVSSGDRVGIRMERSAEAVAVILGTLLTGASYVPLDPAQPDSRVQRLAQRAGCARVVTTVPAPDQLETFAAPPQRPDPTDEAYLLFTSGSTGEPKGVPITHLGLAHYLDFATDSYLVAGDVPVVPLFSALTFDLTVTSLFLPLVSGGRLMVVNADGPAALTSVAAMEDVTWCKATPSHLEILLRLLPVEHQLRTLVVGGEAFGANLARAIFDQRPNVRIFNEYGPTEAVVGCMIHEAARGEEGSEVPIGRPAPGVSLRIVDPHLQPVPIGSPGELLIAHAGLTAGYLDPPEAADDPFVTLDDRRWYRSGDLVRLIDPDTAVYLGRIDEQVKVGGVRLEPVEVEQALAAHPAIDRAAVRLWSPRPTPASQHCVRCGLPSNVPGSSFDEAGVCASCHAYDRIKVTTASYFKTMADLAAARDDARQRRTGKYDCLHLLSGGKDSTYALYQLVEHGWHPYVLTLDNGFISEEALDNVRRSVAHLGLDHDIATVDAMNEIFRDSLDRYSNVCNGCYKTIYTLATNRAVELGIPVIVTGLSRGQLFETRLIPQQFDDERFDPDVIDRAVVQARKAYHRVDDAPSRLLETEVFGDDALFERLTFIDFYRYLDVELAEMLAYLDDNAPWVRPSDTGRSTNCLINAAGIHTHLQEQGFHNYAEPYAWDVRLGHKTRDEAMAELDDQLDEDEVNELLGAVGYEPKAREVLTAWIELGPGIEVAPSPAELRAYLADRLPAHAIPAAFVTVEALPMTTNGKLDTEQLPGPERVHRPGPSIHVSPESELESLVVELWERTLGIEPIGVDDDFFALGGDSLAALQMVVAVSERVDRLLPDELAFIHTTPRTLAAAIEAGAGLDRDVADPVPRAHAADVAPAFSDGELAILFDEAANPDTVRYNVGRLYHVAGPVDAAAFGVALRAVAAVHAPLSWTSGTPRVPLDPDTAVSVAANTDEVDEDEMVRRAEAVHRTPFDLERGPLLRCWIQPMVGGDTTVLLSFHHVSGDAASFDRIWHGVDRVLAGEQPTTPEIDYYDIADWHRATRSEADRDYWLSVASTEPAAQLAIHRPPEPGPDGFLLRAASLTPDELRTGAGATGFATVLASLSATLAQFSTGDRVGLGIIASTRNHAAADDLVGYFLNTLPVELSCTGSATLRELSRDAGPQVGMALAHRTYPFAQILADRRVGGLAEPTTNVLLAYDELPTSSLGGVPVQHRVLFNGDAVADATFFVEVRDDRVDLSMEFNGSVMGRVDAEQLLDRFDTILHAAVFSPDVALDQLDIGTTTGLVEGPELATPVPVIVPILEHMRRQPSAEAVVCAGTTHTYAELDTRSATIASRLVEAGVGAGDRVIVCQPRSFDLVASIVGVLRIGASYVPIDPTYPADRLEQLSAEADAALALIGPNGPSFSSADLIVDAELSSAGPVPDADVAAEDAAYVIFTSGSTGRPRGVLVTHGQLAASNAARREAYGTPSERFLLVSSAAFDSSVAGFYWTLTDGGTLVLPTDMEVRDPAALVGLFASARITHTLLVPTLYQALVEHGAASSAWPAQVVVAGEACPASLVASHHRTHPNSRLTNEYGPTEATVWATYHHCTGAEAEVPIGRPVAGVWVSVVDEAGTPAPEGVEGELIIGGVGVTNGYTNDAEATLERFVEMHGSRVFRTGDQATIRAGEVYFLGRRDNQLNLGGVRVEPEEIERVVLGEASVHACLVVASDPRTLDDLTAAASADQLVKAMTRAAETSDPAASLSVELRAQLPADLRLVAHLEPAPGVQLDLDAVRARLALQLPPLWRPATFAVHDRLPRTPNGKLDRAAAVELPVPLLAPSEAAPVVGTDGDDAVAHRLARLFGDVLRQPPVGLDDSFFDLGGHSLLAMQLLRAVEDRFGAVVTVPSFYESPTPNGMAAFIRTVSAAPSEQFEFLLPIQPEGSRPPIYCVHVLGTNAEYYVPLSQRLGSDQPMFGLVLPDVATSATPRTLDDIVTSYADEIDRRTPDTPVSLTGVSLGSVVALELARELRTRGRRVLLVAMFDAAGPDAARYAPTARERIKVHAEQLRSERWAYVKPRLKFRAEKMQRRVEQAELLLRDRAGLATPDRLVVRRYIEDNLEFMANYEPETYDGHVTIFKADQDPFLHRLAEHGMGWAGVVSGTLEVIEVPGDHLSILAEPQVSQLALEFDAAVQRAASAD